MTALLPSTVRRGNGFGVVETMAELILARGVPEHIQSDDDAEMTASTREIPREEPAGKSSLIALVQDIRQERFEMKRSYRE